MALPASPNTITMGQVNTELGLSATASISLNDAAVRTLAGVGGSGTIISMSDLHGKSAAAPTLEFNDASPFSTYSADQQYTVASITLRPNGSIVVGSSSGSATYGPTSYLNPLQTNAGANYEYRINVTSLPYYFDAYLDANLQRLTSTGFTGWITINVDRVISHVASYQDYSPGFDGFYGTLEIRNKTTLVTISRSFELEIELY